MRTPSTAPGSGQERRRFTRRRIAGATAPRFELTITPSSITDVDARAYVLGLFKGVAPSGAARAIGRQLDGAIDEFTLRRMFSANVGEVFVMPVGRYGLRADLVVFVGLGPFDQFRPEVQQLAAEHVVRALLRTRVDDFATVLFGVGSGSPVSETMQRLVAGFAAAVRDADAAHRFRGVTFCEVDAGRYAEMKRAAQRLRRARALAGFDVLLAELVPTAPPAAPPLARPVRPAVAAVARDPVYLIIRSESRAKDRLNVVAALLTARGNAAVIQHERAVAQRDLGALLQTLDGAATENLGGMHTFGRRLAREVLPEPVRAALQRVRGHHLVIVHDDLSAIVPWETLRVNGHAPAAAGGMSRRFATDRVAKWLAERRREKVLDILLVCDPGGDLEDARKEGRALERLFRRDARIRIVPRRGAAATHRALVQALSSGDYDVFHYAGHAVFDPEEPARSGLRCADGKVLTGSDLAGITSLPALVFCNACESAMIHGRNVQPIQGRRELIRSSTGLAEAFLRGGVANFVGTYWPVLDTSAQRFARSFYGSLVHGATIGNALVGARQRLLHHRAPDWGDYIHYGNHQFALRDIVE